MQLITILTLVIAIGYDQVDANSEIIVEKSELDVSFLSKLRYELRKAPKLAQCLQYWKVLDLKLHGEPLPDQRPILEQANTELLVAVASAMRNRKPVFGTNSLVEYLDECVVIIDQEIRRTRLIREDSSLTSREFNNENNETTEQNVNLDDEKGDTIQSGEQELKDEVQKLKEQLKVCKSQSNSQLVGQVIKLKAELSQLTDINRFLQAQFDLAIQDTDEKSTIDDKEQIVLRQKLNEELERLELRRKEDEKVTANLSDLKLQNLRIQVLQSEIDRLNRHSNLQTQVLNNWKAEKDLLKLKVKGGANQLADLEANNDQLRKQLDKLEELELQNADLKSKVKDLKLQLKQVNPKQLSAFERLFKL